ncbi:MAG: Grx4 family monothiol glutaredoxin [Polyangiaceae bacterium]
MSEDVQTKLAGLVSAHPVVLFMKGSRRFPQCGFSSRVVQILDKHLAKYETVNVLTDPEIRDGVKVFSSWPTIPQLYVRGKFVGGCDIVTEMAETGELATLLGDLAKASAPSAGKTPTVKISKAAAAAFKGAAESDDDHPRLVIDPSYRYDLYFDAKQPGDVAIAAEGVTLLLDAESASRADGTSIDFVDGDGGGFRIENPNEPPRLRALAPKDLAAMRARGEKLELIDVRTPAERATAKIEGDRYLGELGLDEALELPKDTALVFYCHHGHRSRSMASQFVEQGFTRVYNLEGGIDAWARTVDPKVATY